MILMDERLLAMLMTIGSVMDSLDLIHMCLVLSMPLVTARPIS
jgi:hypothetical protein